MLATAYRSCRGGLRQQCTRVRRTRPLTTHARAGASGTDVISRSGNRTKKEIGSQSIVSVRTALTTRQKESDEQGGFGKGHYTYPFYPACISPTNLPSHKKSPEECDNVYHQRNSRGYHSQETHFQKYLSPRQRRLLRQAVAATQQRILLLTNEEKQKQRKDYQSHQFQSERKFSSSPGSSEDENMKPTIDSLSSSHTQNNLSKQNDALPNDKAEMIKGKMNEVKSDQKVESISDGIPKPKKQYPKPKRMLVPNYGPDADRAIRSLQDARKEKANAKTEANVWRALSINLFACAAKLGAWLSSGSSSMMAEFVHSVVDCGNQSLLLMGLRDSRNAADRLHPYGYGKSVYFWALVSALGTFFLGAGVSMTHSIHELLHPSMEEVPWEVWGALSVSFVGDGYVLFKTFSDIRESMPKGVSILNHVLTQRDPATLAILLEDGAACLGVLIAIAGIGATHLSGNPVFDGLAGVGVSCLLGCMGLALVRMNHQFLIGRGVDREMIECIEKIILSRGSVDNVYSIQSQWTGPETFSFKAEIDFDGTFLAAQLMPRYQGEFKLAQSNLDDELKVLLCWYAEDVMRAVEREVRFIKAEILNIYPGAEYIHLEPMSRDADKFAIGDSFEEELRLIEKEEMKKKVKIIFQNDLNKGMPPLDSIAFGVPGTPPFNKSSPTKVGNNK